MGSASEAGRCWSEGPRHEVSLGPFSMAQTPITQAQWQEVASWEPVDLALHPDPSQFKGANRPVEQVSWHEAREFCLRLCRRSDKRYALPSETQWEYACRAGSTTPFHTGTALPAALANCDGRGSNPHATDLWPEDRPQTTDVNTFPANRFGLHDMHGNVWEWCDDLWHSSYVNSPADGNAWPGSNAANLDLELRALRGGSWNSFHRHCRSAYRNNAPAHLTASTIGLRVCSLPESWLLDH